MRGKLHGHHIAGPIRRDKNVKCKSERMGRFTEKNSKKMGEKGGGGMCSLVRLGV